MQSYGMTIFCDDIREELSGKISLIGVYGGDLVVNAPFPLWLPRICFLINAFFNPELTIKSPQLIIGHSSREGVQSHRRSKTKRGYAIQ